MILPLFFRPQPSFRCLYLFLYLFLFSPSFPANAVDHLSNPLADPPDWNSLNKFQRTITHDEFEYLLRNVYASHGISEELVRIDRDFACILMNQDRRNLVHTFLFQRRSPTELQELCLPVELIAARQGTDRFPGLHIALDPGHIGGQWAKIEERWFQIGDAPPVEEGEMTLRVAKMLAPKLRQLGAHVSFVRAKNEPVTPFRPADFTASGPPDSCGCPAQRVHRKHSRGRATR